MSILKYFLPIFYHGYFLNLFGFIFSKEKTFELYGSKVVLLGMVHIGRMEFYKSIKKEYSKSPMLTLSEGVSDSKKLMSRKFSYKPLASFLGLAHQKKKIFSKKDINADLDVCNFDEKTIKALQMVEKILSGSIKLGKLKREDIPAIGNREIQKDLMDRRNEHLWLNILMYKDAHQLLVPWGGAHLPDIERRLLDTGFVKTRTKYRLIAIIPVVLFNACISILRLKRRK